MEQVDAHPGTATTQQCFCTHVTHFRYLVDLLEGSRLASKGVGPIDIRSFEKQYRGLHEEIAVRAQRIA